MTTIEDILGAAMRSKSQQSAAEPPKPLDIQARILRDVLPEIQRPNPFKVGDLVEQIEHLTAYKWPGTGQLAIVVELLENPTRTGANDDRYERCDIAIAVPAKGGLARFAVESFRFRLYTGEVA